MQMNESNDELVFVPLGGVGEIGGEIGEHGVEDGGVDGRGCVVIEVDAVHTAMNRILPAGNREEGRRTTDLASWGAS